MTSGAAPHEHAPCKGKLPSPSSTEAAPGYARNKARTNSMGAPLQHVKCNGVLPVFSSVSLQHAGSLATAARTSFGRTGPPRVNMSMRTPILLLLPRRNAFPRAFNGLQNQKELLNAFLSPRAQRRAADF